MSFEQEEDPTLAVFVRQIELGYKEEDHIGRLHRPGCEYFNLSPYEVLNLKYDASEEEIRTAYRKMSVAVHPDKNPEDQDRASAAFEIVKGAYERLSDPERLGFCKKIGRAASDAVVRRVEKDKKARRKVAAASDAVPEDNPLAMENAIRVMICRMFAEFESRKKVLELHDAEARAKAREDAAEREFMAALERREQRLWEKSRAKRVAGWRSWTSQYQNASKVRRLPNRVKEERRRDGSGGYNSAKAAVGDSYKRDWR